MTLERVSEAVWIFFFLSKVFEADLFQLVTRRAEIQDGEEKREQAESKMYKTRT